MRSIRVQITERLYNRLKELCTDHGDISRIVRALLEGYIAEAEKQLAEGQPLVDPARMIIERVGAKLNKKEG